MNQREVSLKNIALIFAQWEIQLSNLNYLNLLDANIFSEHTISLVLNLIFDFHLINANSIIKNHPAIDLFDKEKRVSIQVTSSKSSKKIQDTLDKFFEKKLNLDYDRLMIIILGKKTVFSKEFIFPDDFTFNRSNDILDFNDLLSKIGTLSTKRIVEINKTLIEESVVPTVGKLKISSAARIKKNLALKKKLKKDFLLQLDKKYWEQSVYEPWIRFTFHNVLIRSVDDKTWPNINNDPRSKTNFWFKGEFWDFYDHGIQLVSMGVEAIFDENGNWDILDWKRDDRSKNPKYKKTHVDVFLRIPYDVIVDYDMERDPYDGIPSIYVEYNNSPPYEVLFGLMGSYEEKKFVSYFDNLKRIKLE